MHDGSSRIAAICDGTVMMCVTRSLLMVSMNAAASNFFISTYFVPRKNAGKNVTSAPLKISEPACITTLSGRMRNAATNVVQYAARIACVWTIPLGNPVVPLL